MRKMNFEQMEKVFGGGLDIHSAQQDPGKDAGGGMSACSETLLGLGATVAGLALGALMIGSGPIGWIAGASLGLGLAQSGLLGAAAIVRCL